MTLNKADHAALSDAIESGDMHTVERLVKQFPELANHPDWTPPPLHCAILWNQPKIAELLLDNGANIERRDPDRHTTPLRYAIMYCKTELIPLLLSRGAVSRPVAENGGSALQLARDGSEGAFEEFDDLPSRDAYVSEVRLLEESGLSD